MADAEGEWCLLAAVSRILVRMVLSQCVHIETPKSEVVFQGINGNECEAFVTGIRELAFAKGKEEDSHWMLHYATIRLRGKALRWHAKLDPSVKKDWDLFVQALFEAYPFVEERLDAEIATPVW
ncbi:hypothetical protein FRC01_008296 [Tulasnella sp. 417]|nr:hypothetical protein FRC01_008296 [Tulasnella sp. 417]